MNTKLRRNYGTAKSKCYGAQPRNQRGDEREKDNLGNLALLVEAVGMVAACFTPFQMPIITTATRIAADAKLKIIPFGIQFL